MKDSKDNLSIEEIHFLSTKEVHSRIYVYKDDFELSDDSETNLEIYIKENPDENDLNLERESTLSLKFPYISVDDE